MHIVVAFLLISALRSQKDETDLSVFLQLCMEEQARPPQGMVLCIRRTTGMRHQLWTTKRPTGSARCALGLSEQMQPQPFWRSLAGV